MKRVAEHILMDILQKISLSGFAVLMTITFSSPAYAQTAGQPEELNAIYACKTKTNPEERLACYDAAVGRFETAQKSGEVVTVSKKEIEKVEREAFGFNIPSIPGLGKLFGKSGDADKTSAISETEPASKEAKKAPSKKIKKAFNTADMKSVELEIKKVTEFGYKKKRFFTTNGQVWEQVDALKVRIPKVRDGKPNTAKISKGALGSFLLRVNSKGTAIKVRRVR